MKAIDGNKIYIKTECISIIEEGIYLILNEKGDCALIPELYTDAAGCFVRVDLKSSRYCSDNINDYKRICPGCGRSYFAICTNPECPLRKK